MVTATHTVGVVVGMGGAGRCSKCSHIGFILHSPHGGCPKPLNVPSRTTPSQWETSLQSANVSHLLGANLESTLPLRREPQGSHWSHDSHLDHSPSQYFLTIVKAQLNKTGNYLIISIEYQEMFKIWDNYSLGCCDDYKYQDDKTFTIVR